MERSRPWAHSPLVCRSLAISSNLGGGGAAHGWKGAMVAERPEGWCREARHSWKYRHSRLRFSCSSLLHPANMSLASARLNTFHSPPSCETHPGRDLGYSVASLYGSFLDEASFRAALPAIESQHVTSPIQIHSRAARVGAIQGLEGEIRRTGIVLQG